jgi:uncharacterized membrane protein YidH (DUF202 family)
MTSSTSAPEDLSARLGGWVELGLISERQATRILAVERGEAVGSARGSASLVAEALGYVGGVLILVAAGTLAGRFWSDLGTGARLTATFAAAALLVGVGAALPTGATTAGGRLRTVVWLLAVVVLGLGLGLLADGVWRLQGDTVVLIAACGSGLCAGLLWWRHRTVVQQAAVVAALAVASAAAVAHLPSDGEPIAGLAVWGVGVAWLVLGWGGVVANRAGADLLGGAVVVIGTTLCLGTDWGAILAVATAVALVAAGVGLRDLMLLGVGSVALLVDVPVVTDRWFPDALAAPLALLVIGVLLVVAAVWAARRGLFAGARHRPPRGGRARVAIVAAVGVVVVVACVVVAIGSA